MFMARIPPRKLFAHAVILLAIVGFTVEAQHFEFLSPGPACRSCDGAGQTREIRWVEDGQVIDVQTCRFCDGSGRKDPWGERAGRFLPALKVGLCELVFLALLAALVWALQVVECRDCGGSGFLALEITSPGEGVSIVGDTCFFCEGRGRLTAVDRWVLRAFDRADPEKTLPNLAASAAGKRRLKSRASL